MELNDFVAKFAEQFDDTDVSDILPDLYFSRIGKEGVLTLTAMGDQCLRKNRIQAKAEQQVKKPFLRYGGGSV